MSLIYILVFWKLMKCKLSHSPVRYNRQAQFQQSSRDTIPELHFDVQLQLQLQLEVQLQVKVQLQVQIQTVLLVLLL